MGRYRWSAALSAGVLLAQAAWVPVLSDPLGRPLPVSWKLSAPTGYTLVAPLFSLWDSVAMLSRSRLTGLLLGLALAYLGWRLVVRARRRVRPLRATLEEVRALLTALVGFGLFVAIGMAWSSRPARRLVGLEIDELTVELHSHTNVSHDVRSWPVAGFDAEQSRLWHQRAGVDVLFVTDHNLTTGWERHDREAASGETLVCPGIEISASGAHVLVLGTPLPADPLAYRGTPENRARLFREVAATPTALTIASLPEYRGEAVQFLAEGAGGFEIVNASPKANEFTRVERDSVIALARRQGVALVAAGDQHGYGASPMAWNVLREPGWRRLGGGLCAAVVAHLRAGGPAAVRIVERARLRPDNPLPGVLTALGVVWIAWATLSPAGVFSWLAWIWVVALVGDAVRRSLRRRRARAILSAVGTIHPSSTGTR